MNAKFDDPVKDTLVKLNQAYRNKKLDGYKALGLKDSYVERSTCNIQWGPNNRV